MNYMSEVKKAQESVQQAKEELHLLTDSMPDGPQRLQVLNAITHLITASVALNYRPPAVPCRLDFVKDDAVPIVDREFE